MNAIRLYLAIANSISASNENDDAEVMYDYGSNQGTIYRDHWTV